MMIRPVIMPLAQECSSKIKTHQNDPMLESTAGSRLTLSNFKDRDTEPGWWGKPCFRKKKNMRRINQNEIDILALQETGVNSDSM